MSVFTDRCSGMIDSRGTTAGGPDLTPCRLKAGHEGPHEPVKIGEQTASKVSRCTIRKHVIENGQPSCDCQALILWPTAAKNALVVTLPPGTVLPDKEEG